MNSRSSSRHASNAAAFPSSSTPSGDSRKRSRNPPTTDPQRPLRSKTKSPFADFRRTGSCGPSSKQTRPLRPSALAATMLTRAMIREYSMGFPFSLMDLPFRPVRFFFFSNKNELRGYMLKHGGRFENYFSKHTVTHIICGNLPDSKMRNLRAFSHGLPVVRPQWVLDCLAANRLLSCAPYQLGGLVNGTCKQQKLSTYFHHQGISSCNDARTTVNHDVKIDVDPKQLVLPPEGQCFRCDGPSGQAIEELECMKVEKLYGEMNANPESTDLEVKFSVPLASGAIPTPLSMINKSYMGHKKIHEYLDSSANCIGACNQVHSTLTDPNFVENYFKSSRLHFIGTWRNRYRKRFSNLLTGYKSSNEKTNCCVTKQKASIIHVDMDCFFVSVIIRNFPDLVDKPVAVCHSNNPRGTAEISSANYVARNYGMKAGMFVRDAKACCPHLVILPYDFEAYEEVAEQFYSILHKHCSKVQALSCDEAFLDVTGCDNDPEEIASMIRKEIEDTTRCTASAGIAGNLLLAYLATRSAKPNGQRFIPSEKVEDYLKDLPVMALPGIGYATYKKLKSRQIQTCGQMCMISKRKQLVGCIWTRLGSQEALQKDFGIRIGDMLWNYCRGIDNRTVEVVQERKSVGAEVNWGIRFNNLTDCHHFLVNLCKEVSLRLQGCGLQGRAITLKVKKRKKGAAEPLKFMGCGDCESVSRTITVPVATDNVVALQRIAKKIFASFHVDVMEVRGIGLHVTKLESLDISRKGHVDNALESWLSSSMVDTRKKSEQITCADKQCDTGGLPLPNGEHQSRCIYGSNQQDLGKSKSLCDSDTGYNCLPDKDARCCRSYEMRASALPCLCDLDIDVVKDLPRDIVLEMDDIYEGELSDFIRKSEKKDSRISSCSSSVSLPNEDTNVIDGYIASGHVDSIELDLGSKDKGKLPIHETLNPKTVDPCRSKNPNKKVQVSVLENVKPVERTCLKIQSHNSWSRLNELHITSTMGPQQLMPASLSQADASVLEQLPEDVKADICGFLPVHRKIKLCKDVPFGFDVPNSVKHSNPWYTKSYLWLGSPPFWVEKFKISNNYVLNAIAMLYAKSGKDILLSSIFQSIAPLLSSVSESSCEECDEALHSLHVVISQYIDLKIGSDVEELYNCFCFLKRFSTVSKLLLRVYNSTLPLFQASMSEIYGGKLRLSVIREKPGEE
ncbi:impB/mucB/samB family C-terminal domain [Musa troglodytarum]|uniref:DNA repair protein REV1 n=1 Tax=Musa troglodytarum TaxID=320322 RepID=A0A9E7IAM5_9LILI|nr:impB/mucB/samB family C-terminal domain [Musa troglodytarum]